MVVAGLADEPGEALAPEARASWAGEGCAPIRPGIVLVRPGIPAGAEDLPRVLGLAGATLESELPALGYVRVRVPEGQERDIAARLMAEGTFAFAEPDYLLTLW